MVGWGHKGETIWRKTGNSLSQRKENFSKLPNSRTKCEHTNLGQHQERLSKAYMFKTLGSPHKEILWLRVSKSGVTAPLPSVLDRHTMPKVCPSSLCFSEIWEGMRSQSSTACSRGTIHDAQGSLASSFLRDHLWLGICAGPGISLTTLTTPHTLTYDLWIGHFGYNQKGTSMKQACEKWRNSSEHKIVPSRKDIGRCQKMGMGIEPTRMPSSLLSHRSV